MQFTTSGAVPFGPGRSVGRRSGRGVRAWAAATLIFDTAAVATAAACEGRRWTGKGKGKEGSVHGRTETDIWTPRWRTTPIADSNPRRFWRSVGARWHYEE